MTERKENSVRDLEGRGALVTGGAGGIGLAIARALADRGARVCLVDRHAAGLKQAAATIGPDAATEIADVAVVGALEGVVAAVTRKVGPLHILVNAAGIAHFESWETITPESFDRTLAVNCRGLLFLTQAVAREMVKAGTRGSIINVTSIAARRGDPTNVVYSMTKTALISLTQSAAGFYGSHGIRVNAIAPGYTQTPMLDQVFAFHGAQQQKSRSVQEEEALQRIPLGRIGTPEDQARAVVFLASDASSYITGQTLNVDGGVYMH
jgi:NAD(P)-dependent dehydrogenase (short-subunit alcohol dehydrogenase family)